MGAMCRTPTWLGCPPDLAKPSASKGVLLHGVIPMHAALLLQTLPVVEALPKSAKTDGLQH